jgi:hypothetical protein
VASVIHVIARFDVEKLKSSAIMGNSVSNVAAESVPEQEAMESTSGVFISEGLRSECLGRKIVVLIQKRKRMT